MTSLTFLAALALVAADAEVQAAAEVPGAAEVPVAAGSRFSLRVHGGVLIPTGITNSEDQPAEKREGLHLGPALDVAVGYRLHPNLALEFATGFRRVAHAEETTANIPYTGYPASWTEFELNMVPLTVGLRAGSSTGKVGAWLTLGAGAFLSSAEERFFDYDGRSVANDDERAVGFGGYVGFAFDGRVGPRTRLGLELRYVKVAGAFEQLNYAGDGLQFMGGLTYQFGAGSATTASRGASGPAAAEPGASAQPAPAGSAARWRFLARLGAFFPTSNDLDILGNRMEGEIGVARSFASRLEGELAVGYFGANARESASLPQLIVFPVTASARVFQPLGADFEASAYAGVGVYVVNFKLSSARDHLSVAPGLHVGVALATRVWGEGSIGLDARLVTTTAKVGGADTRDVDVDGARVGATVAVPF